MIVGLLVNKTTYRIAEESGLSSKIAPKNRLRETQSNVPVWDNSLVGLSTENLGFSKGESKELTEKAYQSIPASQDGSEAILGSILILEPEF